jgi:UDP-N-acetylmuramyl pentapeptide synthase
VRFTTAEVAAATGGTTTGDAVVDGATIDSRTGAGGRLFVAVVAERDGHDFVPAAVEAGAAAVLVERRGDWPASWPSRWAARRRRWPTSDGRRGRAWPSRSSG